MSEPSENSGRCAVCDTWIKNGSANRIHELISGHDTGLEFEDFASEGPAKTEGASAENVE